jgi:hypothetical protein
MPDQAMNIVIAEVPRVPFQYSLSCLINQNTLTNGPL